MSNKKENSKTDNNDSEDILDIDTPDDITSLLCPNFSTVKKSIFLFIIFILISSDVFIDRVLTTRDNRYVEGRMCTLNGVLVQGIILVIGYILIDVLVNMDHI